jgi:quercetin dioxygenase-like cupin family protein
MRKYSVSLYLVVVLALFAAWIQTARAAPAREEQVFLKFSQPLPAIPGKTFTTAVVELAPGARAAPHRHGDAFVYVYVLSGRVRSALEGSTPQTYGEGQDWFEPPGVHHTLTENPSHSVPARLLVVFIVPTGAPLKVADAPGGKQ